MNAKNESENSKKELTPELLQQMKGFEGISESQAINELEIIKRLAHILQKIAIRELRNETNK